MTTARALRLVLLILALLVPHSAAAQFSSALQGTIIDTQQAFVPNATVRVTNTTTGVTREVETSADGVYRVPSLGAGTYTIEIEKAGFLKAQRQNLRLGISETLRLDFTLEVSGVAESVTVESKAPLVETEQGRVSGRVDRMLLQEMPLSGRNLYNCSRSSPASPAVASPLRSAAAAARTTRSPASRRRASTPAASETRPTTSPSTTPAPTAWRAAASPI